MLVNKSVLVQGLMLWIFGLSGIEGFNKYKVPLSKLETCKEYNIEGGYGYTNLVDISSLKHYHPGKEEVLHLKFYLRAECDAHIILSKTNDLRSAWNRLYEIVIGSSGNTKNVIRSVQQGQAIVENAKDSYLLSTFEVIPIEIIKNKGGQIKVFIPGYSDAPILSYTDPSPFEINYIGFSSYGYHKARWFYDCGFEDQEEQQEEVKDKTPKILSNQDRFTLNVSEDSLGIEFQVDLVTSVEHQTLKKSQINIRLNSTDVILGKRLDINTVCRKEVPNSVADVIHCEVSNVVIQ